jgi:hypothetical protein
VNWAAFGAITSAFSVLVTVVGIAYLAGKFTQRINDGDSRLNKHDVRLDRHDDKLDDHGQKIVRLQEWKNGFNAAANVSGNKEVQ